MQISSRFARRILPRPKRVWRTAAILVRSGFYPDPGYLGGFELTKNARFREIRAELAVDCRDLSGNRDINISPPQKKLPVAKVYRQNHSSKSRPSPLPHFYIACCISAYTCTGVRVCRRRFLEACREHLIGQMLHKTNDDCSLQQLNQRFRWP